MSLSQKDSLSGYLFVAPQVIGFIAFVAVPVVAIFVFSLESRNLLTGKAEFIGLQNYVHMIARDSLFPQVLRNSLVFMIILVPSNVLLALGIAILLYRKALGMTLFRTLFFAPVVTSAAAWVLVWQFILQGEQGTLNQLLALMNIQGPNWLHRPWTAMIAAALTLVLKNVGFNMVILLAALKEIPRELIEAANVDGANSWQAFRRITLPLLAPALVLVIILTVIGSLGVFDHIYLLTGGGPGNATNVLAYYTYFQAFRVYEVGYASALAVILFVVALTLTVMQWFMRRKIVYTER